MDRFRSVLEASVFVSSSFLLFLCVLSGFLFVLFCFMCLLIFYFIFKICFFFAFFALILYHKHIKKQTSSMDLGCIKINTKYILSNYSAQI